MITELKCLAPAKINLVLEVLGKRDDGYHEVHSLVQTINLYDILSFRVADVISLECTEPSLQTSDNLVVKAAELLKRFSGYRKGAVIKLQKRIPWGAGLGGGSSDAATTLLALNRLWETGLLTSDLVELAARLGSDVPFFIHNGAALVQGRGEKVTPLSVSLPGWFVLLIPPLPKMAKKTQQLYARLDARHFTGGQFAYRAFKILSRGEKITAALLFNIFDRVAFDAFPNLDIYWNIFEQAGAADIHLVGSGPALFTLVDGENEAVSICRQLHQEGLEAYSVSAISEATWSQF